MKKFAQEPEQSVYMFVRVFTCLHQSTMVNEFVNVHLTTCRFGDLFSRVKIDQSESGNLSAYTTVTSMSLLKSKVIALNLFSLVKSLRIEKIRRLWWASLWKEF